MPSIVISPQPFRQITAIQETAAVSKSTPVLSLTLGENLEALVLNQDHNRKALLQIKNTTVTADTPFPLPIGERLTVRVDQLQPNIVLRMITREDTETLRAAESLKFYRSNPGALKDLIVFAKEFFLGNNLKELSGYLTKKDLHNIYNILNKIIISKDNLSNPLFLKDFILALGLTGERRLFRALSDPATLKDEKNGLTLKEILLKLSSELSPLQTTGDDIEPEIRQLVSQLSNFTDDAMKTIESLQIVNVLAQEQDGLFTLQIPLQLPGGIRMQDIYIEGDRKNEHGRGKQYRIVLFLDMDALGELAIDAGVKEGILRCTIKCPDQESFDFMQALLPELRNTLSAIGYDTGSLQCLLDRDIPSWKQEFLNDYSVYSQTTVNVHA